MGGDGTSQWRGCPTIATTILLESLGYLPAFEAHDLRRAAVKCADFSHSPCS